MCQSFAARLRCVEGDSQPFEIVHAHDWLASGGLETLGKSRSRSLVLTMHSTEYGRGVILGAAANQSESPDSSEKQFTQPIG
jgi:hypothetical protein